MKMKGLFLEQGHLDVYCLKNSRIKISLIKNYYLLKEIKHYGKTRFSCNS